MARNSYQTCGKNKSTYSVDPDNHLLRNGELVKHGDDVIKYLGIVTSKPEDSGWATERITFSNILFPKFDDIDQYLPAQIIGVNERQLREKFVLNPEDSLEKLLESLGPDSIMPINLLTTRILPESLSQPSNSPQLLQGVLIQE